MARDVAATALDGRFDAISTEAARVGEALTIEMIVDGVLDGAAVHVQESRPVVVGRMIRHRISLLRDEGPGPAPDNGIEGGKR